ncbi:MAG: hypothetical protein J2O46_10040, partial [Nocardioides sp.]|nr:hypothetical protein [Nocardioides sp.]
DALQLDSSQAQSARIVLWNLGAYVSGGRLPADVPTDTLLALRNWPDLTRVARIREDTKLAAMLSRRPMHVSDLPDRPNVRAFLAAAWVSGALVRVDAAAARTAAQHGSSLNGHALRGLVSRLRRKAE